MFVKHRSMRSARTAISDFNFLPRCFYDLRGELEAPGFCWSNAGPPLSYAKCAMTDER